MYEPTKLPTGDDYCLNYNCEKVDPDDWERCVECRGLRSVGSYEFDEEGVEGSVKAVNSIYNYLQPEIGKCVHDCDCFEGYRNPDNPSDGDCACGHGYAHADDDLRD